MRSYEHLICNNNISQNMRVESFKIDANTFEGHLYWQATTDGGQSPLRCVERT